MNYLLGVPVLILTTVLGTSAFASLEKDVSDEVKLWFGSLAMLAAVLTALHTHLRFSERSEKHRSLGARYGNVRRAIEVVLNLPPDKRGEPDTTMAGFRETLDELGAEGPVVGRRIFEHSVAMLKKKDDGK